MRLVERMVLGFCGGIVLVVGTWVGIHALLGVAVALAMQSPAKGVDAAVSMMSSEVVMVAGVVSYFQHMGDDVKAGTDLGNKALAKS